MYNKNFYTLMSKAVNEKDIENAYRNALSSYFNENIISPYGTDGFIKTIVTYDDISKKLYLIMEFKYDEDFTNGINVAKVLVQVLYYLKKFEEDGEILPNVTLVADKNEAFVLHNNHLVDYLDENVNWKIAPSSAGENNLELVQKIYNDPNINPFVFDINKNFEFKHLIDKIKGYATNTQRKVRITDKNISTIYDYFISKVVVDYKKMDPNELVSIFISLMLNKDSSYLHPNRKNLAVINDDQLIRVNEKSFRSFFNHFQQDYKPEERRKFTEISDRLIEETKRRSQGEYYTPTAFVEYSQNMLSNHLGNDWRKRFVVWDNSWGTGNLTRDESFENLFASTIHETDLDMGEKYNRQNKKFQYDFLNDDPDSFNGMAMFMNNYKMPKELYEHFQKSDTPILFYFNPPYATGGNANAKGVKAKLDLAKSVVAEYMREEKLRVSEQLYAQFLYRIIKMKQNLNLTNVHIGLFSPSLFLTGQKYKKFRELFFSEFEFVDGILFQASHFADVKGSWAIDFSVWRSKDSRKETQNTFKHSIVDLNEYGEVEEIGQKILWNLDGELTLQDWLLNPTEKNEVLKKHICFTSAFKFSNKIKEIRSDSLGFFINDTNNIEATTKGCYLMPSKINRNIRTITIIESNFAQCMVAFTGRNLFKPNWINQKDEFSAPDEDHEEYKLFEVLSVVYSIFSPKNNVISFRNIKVDNAKYNWNNEWFFMSNSSIRELANNHGNDDIYNDSISHAGERFAYKYLKENKGLLTDEAKDLIILGKRIIESTFSFRQSYHYEHEDKFINTWDASWTQIKQLVTELDASLYKEFDKKFKQFEMQLLEIATKLGFLKYN